MEIDKKITCAFTGRRPQNLPWKFNEEDERCIKTKQLAKNEIEKLIKEGYTNFISGMALGFDTYAAEIVLEMKEKYSDIKLICAIPCKTQHKLWNTKSRKRYFSILDRADYIHYVSEFYDIFCMQKRNEYMISNSSRVIALFDGKKGGTKNTIDFALEKGVEVIVIQPIK